jgi:cytochrome P450 family 6
MLVEAACLFGLLFAIVYHYYTRNYTHWTRLGLPQLQPTFPFGTFGQDIFAKKSAHQRAREEYRQFYGDPCYGSYILRNPALVIKDVEMIKHVLVKDFDHFVDRYKSHVG